MFDHTSSVEDSLTIKMLTTYEKFDNCHVILSLGIKVIKTLVIKDL